MGTKDRFTPLYLGYDDGNGKYDPVLSVFKRESDGGYSLVKSFSGNEAFNMYEILTKKEDEHDAISKSSL